MSDPSLSDIDFKNKMAGLLLRIRFQRSKYPWRMVSLQFGRSWYSMWSLCASMALSHGQHLGQWWEWDWNWTWTSRGILRLCRCWNYWDRCNSKANHKGEYLLGSKWWLINNIFSQQQLQRNAIQLNHQLQQQREQQPWQRSPLQNHLMTDFSVRINRMEFIPTSIVINSMNVTMEIPLQRTVLLDSTTIPPFKDVIGQPMPHHIILTVTLLSNKLISRLNSVKFQNFHF